MRIPSLASYHEGLMASSECWCNPMPANGVCTKCLNEQVNKADEELSQARKLIAELVKMGEFYGNPDNYQRGKKLPHGFCAIFNSIDDDYERVKSHPVSDPFYFNENLSSYGGKLAREVLSNNKDLIEKLTKE